MKTRKKTTTLLWNSGGKGRQEDYPTSVAHIHTLRLFPAVLLQVSVDVELFEVRGIRQVGMARRSVWNCTRSTKLTCKQYTPKFAVGLVLPFKGKHRMHLCLFAVPGCAATKLLWLKASTDTFWSVYAPKSQENCFLYTSKVLKIPPSPILAAKCWYYKIMIIRKPVSLTSLFNLKLVSFNHQDFQGCR